MLCACWLQVADRGGLPAAAAAAAAGAAGPAVAPDEPGFSTGLEDLGEFWFRTGNWCCCQCCCLVFLLPLCYMLMVKIGNGSAFCFSPSLSRMSLSLSDDWLQPAVLQLAQAFPWQEGHVAISVQGTQLPASVCTACTVCCVYCPAANLHMLTTGALLPYCCTLSCRLEQAAGRCGPQWRQQCRRGVPCGHSSSAGQPLPAPGP